MSWGYSFINFNCKFIQGVHVDTKAAFHCKHCCQEDYFHIHLDEVCKFSFVQGVKIVTFRELPFHVCPDWRPLGNWLDDLLSATAIISAPAGPGFRHRPGWWEGKSDQGTVGPARSTSPHSLTRLDPGAVSDSLIRISSLLDGNSWGYNNNHYTGSTAHMIIISLGWNYVALMRPFSPGQPLIFLLRHILYFYVHTRATFWAIRKCCLQAGSAYLHWTLLSSDPEPGAGHGPSVKWCHLSSMWNVVTRL